MIREVVYFALGVAVLGFTSEWVLSAFDDPREPKRLQSRVPLVGHLIGLMRHGMKYYGITSRQTDAELYTIGVGHIKIYICNALHLVPSIQKSSKTLSFRPFIQTSAKRFGGASEATQKLHTEAFVDDFGKVMKAALAPGPHMDEPNMRMGEESINQIDRLAELEEIFLLEWTKHTVMHASSYAIYGDGHPYRTPEVKAAFWVWSDHLSMHLLGMDPTGKGYAARQKIFDALAEYAKNVPDNAAKLLREKLHFLAGAGASPEEVWKLEASFAIALFGNSTPTAFWTFYDIYSRPNILEELRQEISKEAVQKRDEVYYLDVAALKTGCHLLLSVFQETQRTRHQHAAIRKVLEDTVLDGRYLLKKGNFLQIPGEPVNKSERLWGASSREFDAHRFMSREQKHRNATNSSRFTAWGAAPHLCPARQFASTEILILVALMVMRVDLVPLNKTGQWETDLPHRNETAALSGPAKDVKVGVKTREEWSGTWKLEMGSSMTKLPLASG